MQILQLQAPLLQLRAFSLEAFSPLSSLQSQQEICYAPFSQALMEHCFEPLSQAQRMKDELSSLVAS
jgi:hypothetical protein